MEDKPIQTVPRTPEKRSANIAVWILAAIVLVGLGYSLLNQPSPATEAVEQGRKLASAGRYAEAEQKWQEAVQRDPNSADAWAELADYYQGTGNIAGSLEPLRHLAQLKPDAPGLYRKLGLCIQRASDPQALYQQSVQTLQQNPNDLVALTLASTYLSSRDDQLTLLTYLRRMVQLRPNEVDFLVTLAQALVNAHLYTEAHPILDKLVTLAPNNPAGYDLRGQARLQEASTPQQLAEAEADLLKARDLKASSPLLSLNLGRVYIKERQYDKALAHLQEAAQKSPENPAVWYAVAEAFAGSGQPKKAAEARAQFVALRQVEDRISALTKRCVAFPNDFALHLETARLLLRQGKLDKADFYVNRALTLRPQDEGAQQVMQQFQAMQRSFGDAPNVSGPAPSGGRP